MHLHLATTGSRKLRSDKTEPGEVIFSISFIKAGSSLRSKRFRASFSTGEIWDKSKKRDEGGRGEGGFTAPTLPLST